MTAWQGNDLFPYKYGIGKDFMQYYFVDLQQRNILDLKPKNI